MHAFGNSSFFPIFDSFWKEKKVTSGKSMTGQNIDFISLFYIKYNKLY